MEETAKALLKAYALEWIECLGHGGFGTVHKARCLRSGAFVAVKLINKARMQTGNMTKRIVNEVTLHNQLKHPYIVELLDFFENKEYVFLIMECCSRGDVYHHMKRTGKLTMEYARAISHQLLCALAHLHSRNIMHRDLKLSNILIAEDWTIRIADFGLSVQLRTTDEEHYTICGTPNYIAPEIAAHHSHTLSADMWSAGCLIFSLMTGSSPFKHDKPVYHRQSHRQPMKIIMNPKFQSRLSRLPELAQDLIRCLLQKDPGDRLTATQALKHPLFTKQMPRLYPPRLPPPATRPAAQAPSISPKKAEQHRDSPGNGSSVTSGTKESEVLLDWVKDESSSTETPRPYEPPPKQVVKPEATAGRGPPNTLRTPSREEALPYYSSMPMPPPAVSASSDSQVPVHHHDDNHEDVGNWQQTQRGDSEGEWQEGETPSVMRPGIILGNVIGIETPPKGRQRVRATGTAGATVAKDTYKTVVEADSGMSGMAEPSWLRVQLLRIPGATPRANTRPKPSTAKPSLQLNRSQLLSTLSGHPSPPTALSWAVNTPSRATAPSRDHHSALEHSEALQVSAMSERSPHFEESSLTKPLTASWTYHGPNPSTVSAGLPMSSSGHSASWQILLPQTQVYGGAQALAMLPEEPRMNAGGGGHPPGARWAAYGHQPPVPSQSAPLSLPAHFGGRYTGDVISGFQETSASFEPPKHSHGEHQPERPHNPPTASTMRPPPPQQAALDRRTKPSVSASTSASNRHADPANQETKIASPAKQASRTPISAAPLPSSHQRSSASATPSVQPFTTFFLRPKKLRTKEAMIVIDRLGYVHAKFTAFPVRLRVAPDGQDILVADGTLSGPGHARASTSSMPSQLSMRSSRDKAPGGKTHRFTSEALPKRYTKLYRYLSSVMNVLKTQTPVVKLITPTSMCAIMANTPVPDFRYAHTLGWRLKYTLKDKMVYLDSPSGWYLCFSGENSSPNPPYAQRIKCLGWRPRPHGRLISFPNVVSALGPHFADAAAVEQALIEGAAADDTLDVLVVVLFSSLGRAYAAWQQNIDALVQGADMWWREEKTRLRSSMKSNEGAGPEVPHVVESDQKDQVPLEPQLWVSMSATLSKASFPPPPR